MTSDENQNPENEQDQVETPDTAHEDAPAEQEEISPLAALADENADLKDRLLRTVAEMENLRKRTEREVSDARSYAIANFARDMLSATDNLSRALMALPDESRAGADAAVKSLIDGIEMTDREMQRLLQKNGVKPIIAEGERFDPHKHQAVFEVPDSGKPEGTVVQVMQPGFAIGERILRPAMVSVAKGSSKAPVAEEPAAEPASNEVHIDKEA